MSKSTTGPNRKDRGPRIGWAAILAVALLTSGLNAAQAQVANATLEASLITKDLMVVVGKGFPAGSVAVKVAAGTSVLPLTAKAGTSGKFATSTFLPVNYSGDIDITASGGTVVARTTTRANGTGSPVPVSPPVSDPDPETAPAPAQPTTSGSGPTGVPGTWNLTFSDEFDGSTLDLDKWSNCWFSPQCGEQNQVATDPANVAVTNGNLVLTLSSESEGASVSTNPRGGAKTGFEFQYGVAEARIFFAGTAEKCLNWPAWWTNGQNHPENGENDIAEVLGDDMTVNYHSSSGAHNQGAVPGAWCGEFHVYTMHRQEGKADVYYDGELVKSYSTDDGGAAHYLLLNIGTKHNIAPGPESQMKVDYVRVWSE